MRENKYNRRIGDEIDREKPLVKFLIFAACVVALALIFIPKHAHAGDLTLSYIPPTTCEGGEPLLNCPTTGFEISKGAALTGGIYAVLETVASTVVSKRYSNLTPGTYCYSVKTVSNSLKSAESSRACADVPSLPPKAPQGISIKIEVTVSTP